MTAPPHLQRTTGVRATLIQRIRTVCQCPVRLLLHQLQVNSKLGQNICDVSRAAVLAPHDIKML